jgi:hypothetical protein
MKYYIVDTTQSDSPKTFDSLRGLVEHLEGTVKRRFRCDRASYMDNLVSLGYGYDDAEGATFTTSLAEHFNMGIVRNGKPLRTNVHEAATHNQFRGQTGD